MVDSSRDIMTKIPSQDYQNAKSYPRMFSADDQDKDGFKLETSSRCFQVSLSQRSKNGLHSDVLV